jgi:hypothetical protein
MLSDSQYIHAHTSLTKPSLPTSIDISGRLDPKTGRRIEFRKTRYFFLPLWSVQVFSYEAENVINVENQPSLVARLREDKCC